MQITWTSEWILAGILIPLMWIAGAFRWLIGSAWGGLLLALLAYWYLLRHGAAQPFTPSQLLDWFAQQPYEVKLGVAGGLLTMLGFAIAFWTASATWSQQKELELRLEASKAIHARFSRAIRLLNQISAYLFVLIGAIRAITADMPEEVKAAHLAFSNSRATEFSNLRQQLYAAMMDVYDLHAEYAPVFAKVISVSKGLQAAEAAIKTAQQRLAPVIAPYADQARPNFAATFLARCNLPTLEACHAECVLARESASVLYGRSSGALVSAILRPNLLALLNVTRKGRLIGRVWLARGPKLN